MSPILYGAGLTILVLSAAFSVGAIAAAIAPNLSRIWSALRGRGA